ADLLAVLDDGPPEAGRLRQHGGEPGALSPRVVDLQGGAEERRGRIQSLHPPGDEPLDLRPEGAAGEAIERRRRQAREEGLERPLEGGGEEVLLVIEVV